LNKYLSHRGCGFLRLRNTTNVKYLRGGDGSLYDFLLRSITPSPASFGFSLTIPFASFSSPVLALGLATPWVEGGLVLPSVPMFLGPGLSAGFIKYLNSGWISAFNIAFQILFWWCGFVIWYPLPSGQGISGVLRSGSLFPGVSLYRCFGRFRFRFRLFGFLVLLRLTTRSSVGRGSAGLSNARLGQPDH
jgi:hypothetical protein